MCFRPLQAFARDFVEDGHREKRETGSDQDGVKHANSAL
jgi:hypothetical protein